MYFNEEEIKLINECKNSVFECNNENHRDKIINLILKLYNSREEVISILKDVIYNNKSHLAAQKLLFKMGKSPEKYYIPPHYFTSLTKLQQNLLLKLIPIKQGDIFYSITDGNYLTAIKAGEPSKLINSNGDMWYYYPKSNTKYNFIPLYSIMDLWGFLESVLGDWIEIRNKKGSYYFVQSATTKDVLAKNNTKLDALWDAVIFIMNQRSDDLHDKYI